MIRGALVWGVVLGMISGERAAEPAMGPTTAPTTAAAVKLALFPLAGSASAELRNRVAFALRLQLKRQGTFAVVDGVTMHQAASAGKEPDFGTPADKVQALAKGLEASLLVWGQVDVAQEGSMVLLGVLDQRRADAPARAVLKIVDAPEDLEAMTEQIVRALEEGPTPSN